MKVYAGTSGFSYKEWRGTFYPEKLPANAMLAHYAQRLPAVEINNTFYRMPQASQLQKWSAQVPEAFRFSLKAPRRITHVKRLADCEEEAAYLFGAVAALGNRLGSVLFQLPPYFRSDTARLEAFADLLPDDVQVAFEFRHESWRDQSTQDLLSARSLAWVVSDTDDSPVSALTQTADWAYLRLRRSDYDDADLRAWLARLEDAAIREAHVFFKHEDGAIGPRLAERMIGVAAGS